MPIGFIGLGNLGTAMATRLASLGIDLVVWNRTRQKAEALQLEVAESPAALASASEFIILNLFDSAAVRDVLTGDSGVLGGKVRGKVIIDTTTNHFNDVLAFHDLAMAAGAAYLEAPVLGSVVPASQGALTMLVSGLPDPYGQAKPLLEKIAKVIFYLPEPGQASRMKLINNLVLGTFMGALSEATALGEKSGLETQQVLDILAAGAGNSAVLNAKRQKLIEHNFSPHFSVAAIHKDLCYLEDLVKEANAHSYLRPASEKLFKAAIDDGLAQEDFSAVYRVAKGK